MTMFMYDGFDWVGDGLPGRTALRDIQTRGWMPFLGAAIEVDDPTVLWSVGERVPLGKSIHLTGGPAAYIECGVRAWVDSAVGFHFMLDSIPSGGPHKLIEFINWGEGQYFICSTLCVQNGRLHLYSGNELGQGAYDHGEGQIPITLIPHQRYFIHFYSRKSLKIVYVDCQQPMYIGGYGGLESYNGVRLYALGGIHIDDFYSTYTHPTYWPQHCDTLVPYTWCHEGTYNRHKVLTAKPIKEIDIKKWKLVNAKSLIDSLQGDDDSYAITDISWKSGFGVKLQLIWFPDDQLALHIQGVVRSKRTQAVLNQMVIEGRRLGYKISVAALGWTQAQLLAALKLCHDLIHINTVAMSTGNGIFPSINFQQQTKDSRAMTLNVYMRNHESINEIDWYLRIPFETPFFTMETAKPRWLREFRGLLQCNVSNGESVEIFDCVDFDPINASTGKITGRNVGTADVAEGRQNTATGQF